VQEIGGAIERIDDPEKFSLALLALSSSFFTQEMVVGISFAENVYDFSFSGPVDFTHEVIPAFVVYGKVIDIVHGADNQIPRLSCGAGGDIEHGVHRRKYPS